MSWWACLIISGRGEAKARDLLGGTRRDTGCADLPLEGAGAAEGPASHGLLCKGGLFCARNSDLGAKLFFGRTKPILDKSLGII